MTALTPVYGMKYLTQGDPARITRSVLEDNAKTTEAALLRGAIAPPLPADYSTTLTRITALEALGSVANLTPVSPITAGTLGMKYIVRRGVCYFTLECRYAGAWTSGFTFTTFPVGARPVFQHFFDAMFFNVSAMYSPDPRIECSVNTDGTAHVNRALTTAAGGGFVASGQFPVA